MTLDGDLHRFWYADFVRLCLESGASESATDQDGYTALHRAAAAGYNVTTQIIVDSKPALDLVTPDGFTAAMLAAGNGHLKCLRAHRVWCLDINHGMIFK